MTILKSTFACAAMTTLVASGAHAQCQSACSGQMPSASADHDANVMMASLETAPKDIVDTAVGAGDFTTLVAAVQAAGLVDVLKGDGPFTVFAPSDDAFAKLPAGTVGELVKPENRDLLTAILTYHVVPGKLMAKDVIATNGASSVNGQQIDFVNDGGTVRVDNAKVVAANIECSNGVIHVIDTVIMPSTDDILTTAGKAGSFGTLATAIKAAGLAEALQGKGPFTVFAPTDEAFAKLPASTVEALLKPENRDQLKAILKYHVVSGRIYAADAVKAQRAETLEGSDVSVRITSGRLMVDGATVIDSDIEATNGVIHVIDSVILPSN